MSTPYRTPRVPHPPHPTPMSVSQNLSNSKHLKAPIQNPYDKFPQADFDVWINGITGALKHALGQAELEPPPLLKPQSPHWTSSHAGQVQPRYPPVDIHEDDEEAGNETFAEIKARRLGKGKARDPREGPGLQNGHRNEPIEIVSSDEEDIDEVAQSIRVDDDEEEAFGSPHEQEQGELLGHLRAQTVRSEDGFEYEEEEAEYDEEEEEEALEGDGQERPRNVMFTEDDDANYLDHENDDEHGSDDGQFETDEDVQQVSSSRQKVPSQLPKSQLWDEDEDEGDWDEEDEEGEEGDFFEEDFDGRRTVSRSQDKEGSPEIIELISDDDEPQQYTSTPHRNGSNIALPTAGPSGSYDHRQDASRDKVLVRPYVDDADSEEDWEEEEEEQEQEKGDDGLEGNNHEVLEVDKYDEGGEEVRDEQSHDASAFVNQPMNDEILGPQQIHSSFEEDMDGTSMSVAEEQEHERDMLDQAQDAEEEELEAQPDDDDTSFPPHSARKVDDHVDIQDPWEGTQYYAEDLYTGGDRIAPGSNPHQLGTVDDEAVVDVEEINEQPADRNTAFPPQESTPERVVEIPDQWRPLETFAEDFFSGGNVQLGETPLDPSLLAGSADEVDSPGERSLVPHATSPPENIILDKADEESSVIQNPAATIGTPTEDDDIPRINVIFGDGFSDSSEVNNNFTIIPPTPLVPAPLSDFDATSEDGHLSTLDFDVYQSAMLYSAHNFANSFLGTAHLQQVEPVTESLPIEPNATTDRDSHVMSLQFHHLIEAERNEVIDHCDVEDGPIDMDEDVEEVRHTGDSPIDMERAAVGLVTGHVEEIVMDEQPNTAPEPHSGVIEMDEPETPQISIEDEVEGTNEENKLAEPHISATATGALEMTQELPVLDESEQDEVASPTEDDTQPALNTQNNGGAADTGGPALEYEQLPTPPSEINYLPSSSPIQKHQVEMEEEDESSPEPDFPQPVVPQTDYSRLTQTAAPLEYTVSEAEDEQVDELDNDDADGEDEGDEVEILSVISSSDLGIGFEESAYEVEEPITEGRRTEEPPSDIVQDGVSSMKTSPEFTDHMRDAESYDEPLTSGPPQDAEVSPFVQQEKSMDSSANSSTPELLPHITYDLPSELPGNNATDLFTPESVSPRPAITTPDNTTTTNASELSSRDCQPSTSIMHMSLTRRSTDPTLVADPFPASLSTPGIPLLPDDYNNDGDDPIGDRSMNSNSTEGKEPDLADLDFQYPPSPVTTAQKPVFMSQSAVPQLSEDTSSTVIPEKVTNHNPNPHLEVETSALDTVANDNVSPSPVINEPQDQDSSLTETNAPNSLKRKRGPSDATKEPAPAKSKGRKPRGKARKSLSSPEKVEGDVIVVKPRPKPKASVDYTWTPAKPSSSSPSISQKPDSYASSINSSARSERSLVMQVSPTVDKPHLPRLSPAPIVNLFHAHGQKKKINYAPSYNARPNPTRSITPVVDKPPRELVVSRSNTPVPSTLPHLPPTPTPVPLAPISTSTPTPSDSPLAPPTPSAPVPNPHHTVPSSSTKNPSPDLPVVTPARHASNAHAPIAPTSHTPVTRSHCRYHKISLPKTDDDGSPRVFFLVPGCSLTHPELMRKEEIEDHGEATQDDGAHMMKDIDTLNFDSSLIGVLRQLVGLDILREQEVFYLPSPGDEVGRKHPRLKTFSEKASMIRSSEGSNHSASPGLSASPKAPVSAANSASTSRSAYHKRLESGRESVTPSVQSGSDDDTEEGPLKRIRSSPADVTQEVGSMGPPKLIVKKARRSARIDTTYEPDDDVNDEDEVEQPVGKRRRKPKKRGVKRTRTADTLEDDKPNRKSKKLKTHATMPSFTSAPVLVDSVPESQPHAPQS